MLRILTINTHKGFSHFGRRSILEELRQAIGATASDLVFLQEVRGGSDDTAAQYEVLADTLWPHYSYGRNAVYPSGHHGNALLSRFPIANRENIDVSLGRVERRGLLHAVLDLGKSVMLHAICLHLGLRERHRRRQLQLLCEAIAARVPSHAPLVVAGDFNDWRGRAHQVLRDCAGLAEVHTSATGRAALTFPARWPCLRLDRIYVRNIEHQPVMLPASPWARLSDHIPLCAELQL